jgi:hypothetical protein
MTNPADSFFGDSAKSAKFDSIGETVGGPITHIGEPRQQTEFGSGKPLTWDDGSPRMQLPITVQTNQRDPHDPQDDGKRVFYVKGEMKKAITAALRATHAKMAIGGTLTLTYVGDEPTKGFPKKLYQASYTPPAPGAGFFDQGEPQQQAHQAPPAQQYAPPVQAAPVAPQAPAAQPGMVQLTPEQYAAMQAAMAQQAAPAQAPAQQAVPADYAAQMGFPTDKAPF